MAEYYICAACSRRVRTIRLQPETQRRSVHLRGTDSPMTITRCPRCGEIPGVQFLHAWMRTANPMLGNVSPLDMCKMGFGHRLAQFIEGEADRTPDELGTIQRICEALTGTCVAVHDPERRACTVENCAAVRAAERTGAEP